MGKSEQIRRAEMSTILKMLMDCYTGNDIITELKIPHTTYYRYRRQIYKDYADLFLQQKHSDVGFHTEQLHNRLTKYLRIIEKKFEGCTDKDAAALAQTGTEIARMIFDLGLQGLEVINDIKVLDGKMQHVYNIKELDRINNNDNDDSEDEQQAELLQPNQTA